MNKAGNDNQRYHRQLILKDFGEVAQQKLSRARVLVIGAGGLGCPALQYLAAAGVGKIGVVDGDRVELSNLQRQTLYSTDDIGQPKATTAAQKLRGLNPEIEILAYDCQLTNQNALELLSNYDVVVDGSDNFPTRYMVNDACVLLGKPLIYGAVLRFEGQVGVFNHWEEATQTKVNYRHLFPQPPGPESSPTCEEAGVLGILPGVIGTLQASEAIKVITGIGKPLSNSLLSYHALNNQFYQFEIGLPVEPPEMPESEAAFLNFDYALFCNSGSGEEEISLASFHKRLLQKRDLVIDVREENELPEVNDFECIRIPLPELRSRLPLLSSSKPMIFICKTGSRSLRAVRICHELLPKQEAYSLAGGIQEWKRQRLTNP